MLKQMMKALRKPQTDLNYNAKVLRHRATKPERIFARMCKEAFPGLTFRTQYVIPPYIVDFYQPDHKLVIEIDGGHHNDNERDKKRDKTLKAKGYKVLRFWNNEVTQNIEGVYTKLNEVIEHER